MDGMTLEKFEEQVFSACLRSHIVASVAVSGSGITWLRLRAYLVNGMFIDAYCNEPKGRLAFALIQEGRRIFGADNTGGWHWHPFEKPDEQSSVKTEITFETFFHEITKRLEKL
jgi:hypothetical protein